MRAPAFWWRERGLRARLLRPLGAIYGAISGRRLRRAGTSAGIPVVCIGNLTLGGAGKTPAALAIAQMLAGAGAAPGFLTRGYGGRTLGPLRVDPAGHSPGEVGDEALLLAAAFPTIVARDRVAGAKAARETGAEIVVMDDGFHNPTLQKDFSILVVDGARGIGNGFVFPAGPLRAPLEAQLRRADALIFVGEGRPPALIEAAEKRGIPIFPARLLPDAAAVAALAGKGLLAYAGIGHPDKFFATLRACGADVRGEISFADHHPYSEHDMRALIAEAERGGLALITTAKDWVRLPDNELGRELRARSAVLPVTMVFDNPAALLRLIMRAIRRGP
jgi:tetraacyldisaccharide 4'-kinase